jgi:hypothetical protein
MQVYWPEIMFHIFCLVSFVIRLVLAQINFWIIRLQMRIKHIRVSM